MCARGAACAGDSGADGEPPNPPITPDASTTSGYGTENSPSATSDAAAIAMCAGPVSARRPIRIIASITSTSTAALMPDSAATIHGT